MIAPPPDEAPEPAGPRAADGHRAGDGHRAADGTANRDLERLRSFDLDHCLRDLDFDRDCDRDLIGTLVRVLALDHVRVHDLVWLLRHAPELVRDLVDDLALARRLDLVRAQHDPGLRYAQVVAVLQGRWTLEVEIALRDVRPAAPVAPDVVVARTAGRIAAWAVCLLPAPERARYAAEFRSELWELAAAGAGRFGQLRHAFSLLVHGPSLRRELQAVARAWRSAS